MNKRNMYTGAPADGKSRPAPVHLTPEQKAREAELLARLEQCNPMPRDEETGKEVPRKSARYFWGAYLVAFFFAATVWHMHTGMLERAGGMFWMVYVVSFVDPIIQLLAIFAGFINRKIFANTQ